MLFPYYKNGLWGLCDSNKKIIVEPKYNKVEWIDGNYYKVYKQDSLNIKNKKVGLVNEVGKMIVHDTFNYILFFHNQQNIPTLIQASFDSINSSYFSINGNYLFTSSNSFYNNYEYASLCEPFIIFTVRYRYDNFVYYHIPSGQIVKKQLRYLEQIPFIKGSLILTLMDMKKIQIDSNNKPVANPYYKDVIHHGNNVYSAIVNKKRVWLNENGKRIANKDFLWIDKFVGKYAVVRKGDKLGVVDNKYNLIIPYKYYDIKIISNNRFFVKYSKWGMLNTKNQQKIALKYENLEETNIYLGSKNNNLILGTNSEHRNGYTQNIEDLFLANGQHLSHSKNGGILRRYININETSLWNEDYGVGEIVKYWPSYKNDSCVLVDKNLNPKSKKYKSLKLLNGNLCRFEEKEKIGVMRLDGSIVLPAIYHYIPGMQGNHIMVGNNYLLGIIKHCEINKDSSYFDTIYTCTNNINFPYYGYSIVKTDTSKIANQLHSNFDHTQDGLVLKSKNGTIRRIPFNNCYLTIESLAAYKFQDSNYLKEHLQIDDNLLPLIDSSFNISEFITTKLWGLVDTNNHVVLPIEQEEIAVNINNNWRLKTFNNFPHYEPFKIYYQNITSVKHNNKIGFFRADGNYLIKPEYEDVRLSVGEGRFVNNFFQNGVAIVSKNGKFGVIDTNNIIIIPFKYNYIFPTYYNPNIFNCSNDNGTEEISIPLNNMLFNEYNQYWGKTLYYLYQNEKGKDRKLLGLVDENGNEYFDR